MAGTYDQPATSPCLTTVVQNTSGVSMFFGFLGAHGATLPAGGQHNSVGDLVSRLMARPTRGVRDVYALDRALAAGTLAILSSPALHVYDAIESQTKIVTLSDNVLDVQNPCWGTFASA
jgi:hypothetical protein